MTKTLNMVDAALSNAEKALTTGEYEDLVETLDRLDTQGELDGSTAQVVAFINAQAAHTLAWRGAE